MKSFIDHLIESNEHYEKAEEHLSKANDAEAKGDKKSFHAHMADHHDAMSEWHDSKGRSASADKHAEKADYHHEKSLSESVELTERREDDEYHNGPDPVKHTYKYTVSKDGGEKHQRDVTTGLTTRPKHELEHLARKHLEKQGYKIHEEVVNELSTELLQRYKDKAMQSSADLSSKGKYKKSTDRLMAHMKATGKQIDKLKKEETEVCPSCKKDPCWCDDSHGFVEGKKPEHNMGPGWMLKADPELAKKVADNKKKYKSFKDTVGKKIETK